MSTDIINNKTDSPNTDRYEQITSSDNTHYLYHTFFEPKNDNSEIKATLLIVHGMAEHSGRYRKFAQFLADNGIAVATYDQLGHGKTVKSPDDLGFFTHEHPVQSLLKDVILMADVLKTRYPNVPHFIMGHSMGSFIVRTVLKHHAQDFTGAVIMGTADTNILVNMLIPFNRFLATTAPRKQNPIFATLMNKILNSKISPCLSSSKFAWLSEDPTVIKCYEADPLTGFDFTNNGFLTLFILMQSGLHKNWATTIAKDFPMLFVSGENDPVGDMGRGIRRITRKLEKQKFSQIDTRLYPNMRHEPLHEQHHSVVYHDILHWINRLSA